MNKKPIIVTDVDSVKLDWLHGFTKFLNNKGICTKHIEPHLGTTRFIDTKIITQIDCSKTNKQLIAEFGKSGGLEELRAFQEDSVKHIQELHKDVDFVALSCLSTEQDLINQRIKNLEKVYGKIYKDVICIDYGQSKEPELVKLNNQEDVIVFVDDREKHIQESISAGVPAILFERGMDKATICPNNTFRTESCWGDIKNAIQIELDLKSRNDSTNNKALSKKSKFSPKY